MVELYEGEKTLEAGPLRIFQYKERSGEAGSGAEIVSQKKSPAGYNNHFWIERPDEVGKIAGSSPVILK